MRLGVWIGAGLASGAGRGSGRVGRAVGALGVDKDGDADAVLQAHAVGGGAAVVLALDLARLLRGPLPPRALSKARAARVSRRPVRRDAIRGRFEPSRGSSPVGLCGKQFRVRSRVRGEVGSGVGSGLKS